MKCVHGIEYPCEGIDPNGGPWTCRPDGSNPNCEDCGPDDWAEAVHAKVDEEHD